MKILLIAPPSYRFAGFYWSNMHLGLAYLGAVLRNAGHEVEIYDANVEWPEKRLKEALGHTNGERLILAYRSAVSNTEHPVWREVREVISGARPQVVGITCKFFDMKSALKVAALAKEVNGGIFTVMGGAAPTTTPEMFALDPSVDLVVRSEGELTMAEAMVVLASSGRDMEGVRGVSFARSGKVIHTPLRALIEDLDSLPFPLRTDLLLSERLTAQDREYMMGDIVTGRGCPYGCTFCANHTVWGRRGVRLRSAGNVVSEVETVMREYGTRRFTFWDDHFASPRSRAMEMCELLAERCKGIEWVTFVRANTVDDELLAAMRRAGCVEVQMGVETGSERILRQVCKGITIAQIISAAKCIRRSGIRWHAFLMIGFPGETKEEMKATMRLVRTIRPDRVQLSIVTAYPGTEMFNELLKSGAISGDEWMDGDTYDAGRTVIGTMAPEEFQDTAQKYFGECDNYNRRMLRQRPSIMVLFGRIVRKARLCLGGRCA